LANSAWLIGAGRLHRLFGAGVLLVAALIAVQFSHQANAVSFAVGLLAFGAAMTAPRLAILAVTGGLASWTLAAPFLTPILFADTSFTDNQPVGWIARIEIWKYTSAHILDAPLFGHGLDSARTVQDIVMVRGEPMRGIPLHPHSAVLQIWYELGALGALLATATLVSGGWMLSRLLADRRAAAAGACAALASTGIIWCVGYGLWQEWWVATMCVSAALLVAAARSARA